MARDVTWASTRISEAHRINPSITESVLTNIENLLKAQLSEHQLSPKELADTAKILIAANGPAPVKTEATK